ncbi:tRNA (adenine(22)-N(1))-methyltransferase [Spiroplasma turonicum]|uniref:tRNA: m1A22 methyltransferase n=1 Tax=Spiroplasma turonicum TaxID=216946 RepID=A0A0K1P5G8_9MOLU|nr:class I SAM-dependent methyltransferase [Spiroplasma turonicum]AKU79528.1 tRNA: m1A22 methyltransferase [Spiroplasma turonicum]ALX70551.1 tRNA: m1A22 methyltransferase [Spiroplasma turonicum]
MSFLTPRLFALAKLINDDDIVADIGTDHAYLPIYLAKDRKAKKIFATDIANGPLTVAKDNIRSFGVEDKIELLLEDGIKWTSNLNISIDVCIISGVGSNTMQNILKFDNKNIDSFIFCSTNSLTKLREWTKKQKYFIEKEMFVIDNDIFYEIIKVNKYAGTKVKNKKDILFGPILRKTNDKIFIQKLMLEEQNIMKIINKIPKTDKNFKDFVKTKRIISSILKKGIKNNDKTKN